MEGGKAFPASAPQAFKMLLILIRRDARIPKTAKKTNLACNNLFCIF